MENHYQLFNIAINADKKQEHLSILKIIISILYQDKNAKNVLIAGKILSQEHKICPEEVELLKTYLAEISKYCRIIVFSTNNFVKIAINSFISELTNVVFVDKYGKTCLSRTYVFMRSDDVNGIIRDENAPEISKPNEILEGGNEKIIITGKINKYPVVSWDFMQKYNIKLILFFSGSDPEFITNSVAGSGNIMQENSEDKSEKGMIKWENYSGKFIRLNIEYGYVRFYAESNKLVDSGGHLPTKPYSVILEHSNCSEMFVEELSTELYRKYGSCVKIMESKNSKNKSTETSANMNNILMENIRKSLEDWSRHPPELPEGISANKLGTYLKTICDNFGEYICPKAGQTPRKAKWRIKKLLWSNCYCYDEYNVINFDVGIVTGCIADNKYGKSSIIDILLFVLFDYVNRGTKSNIQNKFSRKKYAIVCHLEISGITFIIDKRAKNLTTYSTMFMYIDESGKTVNITGETNDKTYKIIESHIGGVDAFLKINCIRQNAHESIWRKTQATRNAAFTRLFGLDMIENYKMIVSEKIKTLSGHLSGMAAGSSADHSNIIDTYEKEYSEYQKAIDNIDVDLTEKSEEKLILYRKYRSDVSKSAEELGNEIQQLTRKKVKLSSVLSELAEKLRELDIKFNNNIPALKDELNNLLYNLTPADSSHFRENISELEEKREVLRTKSDQNNSGKYHQASELHANVIKLINLNNNLVKICEDIADLYGKLPEKCGEYVVRNGPAISLNEQKISDEINSVKNIAEKSFGNNRQVMAEVNKLVEKFWQIRPADKSEMLLNREISAANIRSVYRFSDQCKECKSNQDNFQSIINHKKEKLSEILKENETIKSENAVITEEINKIIAGLKTVLLDGSPENPPADPAKGAIIRLHVLNSVRNAGGTLAEITKLETKKAQLLSEITKTSDVINKNKIFDKTFLSASGSPLEDLEREIMLHYDYQKYKKDNEKILLIQAYLSKFAEFSEVIQLLKQLGSEKNIAMENERIHTKIGLINQKIIDLDKQKNNILSKMRKLRTEIDTLSGENKHQKNISEKKMEILTGKLAYETFLRIISAKGGVITEIMEKKLLLLINGINSILCSFDNHPIAMNGSGGIVVKQDDTEIPLDMTSGYQQLMIDIATRMTLFSLSECPVSDILIIDEGFNCFDKKHTKTLSGLFVNIKALFGTIIIISHNEDINVKLDKQIYINRKGNKSSVIFSESPGDFNSIIFVRRNLPVSLTTPPETSNIHRSGVYY